MKKLHFSHTCHRPLQPSGHISPTLPVVRLFVYSMSAVNLASAATFLSEAKVAGLSPNIIKCAKAIIMPLKLQLTHFVKHKLFQF